MSPELFGVVGVVFAVAAILMGLALGIFWPDKDKVRAQRLLSALYYLGMAQIVIGTVAAVVRAAAAA